jgi:hypothetical protein
MKGWFIPIDIRVFQLYCTVFPFLISKLCEALKQQKTFQAQLYFQVFMLNLSLLWRITEVCKSVDSGVSQL